MSTKGKRYAKDAKQDVVDFVNKYNAENGRGGVANASKKFDVTQMTINNWVKKAESGATAISKTNNIFSQLGTLKDQIDAKEAELSALKDKFDGLKAQL